MKDFSFNLEPLFGIDFVNWIASYTSSENTNNSKMQDVNNTSLDCDNTNSDNSLVFNNNTLLSSVLPNNSVIEPPDVFNNTTLFVTEPSAIEPVIVPVVINNMILVKSVIDKIIYNNQFVYRIKRSDKVFLLQQNIGQIFWGNLSTFNSVCWNNKLEKVAANMEELKQLKNIGAIDKGSRKANLLPFEAAVSFLQQTRKDTNVSEFQNLVLTSDGVLLEAVVQPTITQLQPTSQSTQTAQAMLNIIDEKLYHNETITKEPPITKITELPTTPLKSVISSNANSTTLLTPLIGLQNSVQTSTKKKKYTLSEEDFSDVLKVQLADLQTFWMNPNSTRRQAKPVNITTHTKRKERILCYLGWVKSQGNIHKPDCSLFDIESNNNRNNYEQYLTYLKDIRQISDGTIIEHITAAIYVLKFIHISNAEFKYTNVPAIRQLKTLRNSYQRSYEKNHKKNWVELREEDKFLHYEEIQLVVKELLDDFLGDQTDPLKVYNFVSADMLISKAKELQKFLILLFYTSLPPARALEIRDLQLEQSLQWRKTTNSWWIVLDNYKTSTAKGIDSTELEPQSQQVLITYLELFINVYRPHLITKWLNKNQTAQDQQYLFIPSTKSKQQNFSESGWSQMISSLFKKKTGMTISINSIRSSFVTNFYSSDASNNQGLSESIANGMRHSVTEAKKTYDRRTDFEKKRKAVEFCGNNMIKSLTGEDRQTILPPEPKIIKTGPAGKTYDDSIPHTHPINIGDIVAVPFVDDNNTTDFWLGKCLRIETESTILLAWLKNTDQDANKYKVAIGASWEENSNACIFPIDIQYDIENRVYVLYSNKQEILETLKQ